MQTESGWETCLSHTGSICGQAGNKHRQTIPPTPPSIVTPHHPWAPPAPRMRASQSSLIDKVTRTLGLLTVSICFPFGQERWWQLIIYFRPGAPERFIDPLKIEHSGGVSTTPKSQLAVPKSSSHLTGPKRQLLWGSTVGLKEQAPGLIVVTAAPSLSSSSRCEAQTPRWWCWKAAQSAAGEADCAPPPSPPQGSSSIMKQWRQRRPDKRSATAERQAETCWLEQTRVTTANPQGCLQPWALLQRMQLC